MGSEPAEPDWLFAHDDDFLHERSGTDPAGPGGTDPTRCSTRATASSAMNCRSCPARRNIWIRQSCRHPRSRKATTIPIALIPMPRQRSAVDGDAVRVQAHRSACRETHSLSSLLGDQSVTNYGYSGPSAKTAPFNQKTITRHYGFGNTRGHVTIGGVPVPRQRSTAGPTQSIPLNAPSGVPPCAVQQQGNTEDLRRSAVSW